MVEKQRSTILACLRSIKLSTSLLSKATTATATTSHIQQSTIEKVVEPLP